MNETQLRWCLAELRELPDPTDDDVARCDAFIDELEKVVSKRQAEEARSVRVAELERQVASGELRTAPAVPSRTARHDIDDPYRADPRMLSARDARDTAYRAVERADLDDASKGHVDRLLRHKDFGGALARHILVTGSDAYRDGWAKLSTDNAVLMSEDERAAVTTARALSMTTNQGGYAVPFTLDPTIILTNAGTLNPIRAISRVESITTEAWNGVSTAGITAEWTAEAVAASDNAPTLDQPIVPVHKATAFVPFSLEIGGDWANIANDVAMMIGDAKARLEAAAFATGSGNGQPTGIVTALDANTNSEVAVTTNNSLGAVDIYAVYAALGPRFRPAASWVMNTPYINLIRQFGTSNNYHGFTVDLTPEGIPSVLGKPVYEASDMDSAVGTGTDNALVIGDFSNYLIADRVGLSVELIPHLFDVTNNRPTGQRGWYAWWRVGADSINDAAFRLLQV
jgi:HK97 family phage major capsid protein